MNLSQLLSVSRKSCHIQGLWGSAKGWFLAEWIKYNKRPILVITEGPHEAESIFYDLQTFYDGKVSLFPELEPEALDLLGERYKILENFPSAVVTSKIALRQKVIPKNKLQNARILLEKGGKLTRENLFKWLIENGYDRTDCVSVKGEFGHRGGIVDIFPPNAERPVRLEYTGDTVLSIRVFDPETQCSIPCADASQFIYPVVLKEEDNVAAIEEYLPDNGVIVLDELEEKMELDERDVIFLSELVKKSDAASVEIISLEYLAAEKRTLDALQQARKRIFEEIRRWAETRFKVNIFCNNTGEKERLLELLKENGITKHINLNIGRISGGFLFPEEKFAVISDSEIFCRYKIRFPRRISFAAAPIKEISELVPGSYVVHVDHGIGKYLGIKKAEDGEKLVVQYDNKAKLYVPLDHAYLVTRYMGLGGRPPALDKLGGTKWLKTKIKVERALAVTAAELLDMQAKRDVMPGIAFSKDTTWQKEMEDAFIYEETPDQKRAAEEVKSDMEKKRAMDRLLCGDVGYGKTEVAVRSAFKAVQDGKQVAVLVPTTVLAQQHYRTFADRLADYPVCVEMLSRFRSDKEQKEIIRALKEGKVDIIIGTHRLIQSDVVFKDLSLVIIDEEQRFGVRHKERLKKLRTLVDVLTLTATPIPRTLYMALVGIRDMSVINTPPRDRLAVKTILAEYDEGLIRRAILDELLREGQVFFLHNRVEDIERVTENLKKLVPSARFITGHGQMDEELLAVVMDEFIQGRADVLVCTTIIQSGIDIPNVNTIIIDDADRFGLADLYQLRGRVGRFKHQAYAYLLLPKNKPLEREARKRLKAIQDFSHLGSGFNVAMQDMEIRGAGNIMGQEQHGHIHAVGFDLYCMLLRKNIMKLQGKEGVGIYEVTLDLGLDGYIPIEYIPTERLRIDFYRRIASALLESELDEIEDELADRFGPVPYLVKALLDIAGLKLLAITKGVKEVRIIDTRVQIIKLDGRRILEPVPRNKDKLQWIRKKICGMIYSTSNN